jgi:dihydroorotase
MMRAIINDSAKIFGRAVVMPNLLPPITTVDQAIHYRQRILKALPANSEFNPLMTLYLTDNTSYQELEIAAASPYIHGIKLYPAGATTNSDAGITSIEGCYPLIETMQQLSLPLLIHGESTQQEVDIFDREKVFLEKVFLPLCQNFPNLKTVLEHITTNDAVQLIKESAKNVAATVTAHHLLINRNDLLGGGIKPHNFCLPIVKREKHRQALLHAVTSGSNKFFLGTDSAPHPRTAKESTCGCAGIYTAHQALPLYAEAFDSVGKLDKLEGFASHYGADFYGLPRNKRKIILQKKEIIIPKSINYDDGQLIPFRAGEKINWSVLNIRKS